MRATDSRYSHRRFLVAALVSCALHIVLVLSPIAVATGGKDGRVQSVTPVQLVQLPPPPEEPTAQHLLPRLAPLPVVGEEPTLATARTAAAPAEVVADVAPAPVGSETPRRISVATPRAAGLSGLSVQPLATPRVESERAVARPVEALPSGGSAANEAIPNLAGRSGVPLWLGTRVGRPGSRQAPGTGMGGGGKGGAGGGESSGQAAGGVAHSPGGTSPPAAAPKTKSTQPSLAPPAMAAIANPQRPFSPPQPPPAAPKSSDSGWITARSTSDQKDAEARTANASSSGRRAETTQPVLRSSTSVPYPERARRSGAEGVVRVRVFVDEQGKVVSARVIDSSGVAELDAAASEAVRSWQFEPAKQDGLPVPGETTAVIEFRLQ